MTIKALLALGLVGTLSCASDVGRASSSILLPDPDAAPGGLRTECSIAERRCSRCHPLDRIVDARVASPAGWQSYVRRMRLTPGSGIPVTDEPAIVRCLVFGSFGPVGLKRLEASEGYR